MFNHRKFWNVVFYLVLFSSTAAVSFADSDNATRGYDYRPDSYSMQNTANDIIVRQSGRQTQQSFISNFNSDLNTQMRNSQLRSQNLFNQPSPALMSNNNIGYTAGSLTNSMGSAALTTPSFSSLTTLSIPTLPAVAPAEGSYKEMPSSELSAIAPTESSYKEISSPTLPYEEK